MFANQTSLSILVSTHFITFGWVILIKQIDPHSFGWTKKRKGELDLVWNCSTKICIVTLRVMASPFGIKSYGPRMGRPLFGAPSAQSPTSCGCSQGDIT